MKDSKSIRQDIFDKVMNILEKNNIKYVMAKDSKKKFINNEVNIYGEAPLILSIYDAESMSATTSYINKELSSLGGHAKHDSYNTLYVYYDDSLLITPTEDEAIDEFAMPDNDAGIVTVEEILNSTNKKKIYLTSDWHFFKNHYKHEANYVNTQKIVTWCRQNIKDDDVFMYLGDISFRYANEEDQKESARILSTIPGIKILILGNHDMMLGEDYFESCGFDYIFEQLVWNNLVFTHRPINMMTYPDEYLNIHGHIHNIRSYNTCDGKRNINVYPLWYDNKPVTLDYVLNHVEELVKDNYWNKNYGYDESAIEDKPDFFIETKRSNLPDSAFGIPEDRKYPLDTEQHVRSAIKLFGHAEESKKKSLAKRIKSAAKKYNISVPENTQCYKYLTESGIEDIIPSDVTSIVFDMGHVLVNSNIGDMILHGLPVRDHLAHVIHDYIEELLFYNEEELEHYSIDEAKQYFIDHAPSNIKPHVEKIFELMAQSMHKYSFVDELLATLRSRGYKIYYLSNWPQWSYDLEKSFFDDLTKKFDGGIFSCHSAYMKPDERFYLQFLKKFNLRPEECFFFDDKAENINGAEKVGIRGYLFDADETPKLLLDDHLIPPSEADNQLIIDKGLSLEAADLSSIKKWFCTYENSDKMVMPELFYDDFNEMIHKAALLLKAPTKQVIYTKNDDNECLIPVGVILLNPDETFEWIIQYPLSQIDGRFVINEYSMAAMNPIIGASKPFIVKMGLNNVFGANQYAFAPDIISDKYLVIDENAQFKIVDKSILEGYNVEVYEFIGDKKRISKLAEAYTTNKTVDNTVFYTTLTGKPMLCPDQIDYDTDNFRKVNFEQMIENAITEMATTYNGYLESIGYGACWASVLESTYIDKIEFLSKYKNSDISIREDFDGYYAYSELTKKRSRSVATPAMVTEEMIISIL